MICRGPQVGAVGAPTETHRVVIVVVGGAGRRLKSRGGRHRASENFFVLSQRVRSGGKNKKPLEGKFDSNLDSEFKIHSSS